MSGSFKRHIPKPAKAASVAEAARPARAKPGAANKQSKAPEPKAAAPEKPEEIGGPEGPEPTRYGDWEIKGRCIDF